VQSPRFFALVATAALMISGCGGPTDGLVHHSVSGEVTLEGQPLDGATIVFVPIGFEGPPVGGVIQAGSYSIPTRDGPIRGEYATSIYAKKKTGKTFPDPNNAGEMIEESFETIPARYNIKTELKASVTEAGPNRFDYKLTDAIKSPPSGGTNRR
jgi:hypothetical protein